MYETINEYAKTFSEFLRKIAMKVILKQENIERLNIDLDNLYGKEITLDDLL